MKQYLSFSLPLLLSSLTSAIALPSPAGAPVSSNPTDASAIFARLVEQGAKPTDQKAVDPTIPQPWDNSWSVRVVSTTPVYPLLDRAVEIDLINAMRMMANTHDPDGFVRDDYPDKERGFMTTARDGTYLRIKEWVQGTLKWRDIQQGLPLLDGVVMTPREQGGPGRESFKFVILGVQGFLTLGEMSRGVLKDVEVMKPVPGFTLAQGGGLTTFAGDLCEKVCSKKDT